MIMPDNLHLILEKGYHTFDLASPVIALDVCTSCCLSKRQELDLRTIPVREIPVDLLEAYNHAAKSAQPPIDDIRYLAPRFLDLVASFQFPAHSVELSLKCFGYYSAADWTAEELDVLRAFQTDFFSSCLDQYPLPDLELIDSILVMLWKMDVGVDHVLDVWLKHDTTTALLHLSDLLTQSISIGRVTKFTNSFADDTLSDIVVSWLSSEVVREHFHPLLEQILVQSTEKVDEQQQQVLSYTYDLLHQLSL